MTQASGLLPDPCRRVRDELLVRGVGEFGSPFCREHGQNPPVPGILFAQDQTSPLLRGDVQLGLGRRVPQSPVRVGHGRLDDSRGQRTPEEEVRQAQDCGRLVPVDGATGPGGPAPSRTRSLAPAHAHDLPVIVFEKDDKVAYLGTTLLDPEHYPAAELVALRRERWEIELAFDEIKNHLGPGGPIRSRTPEGVRQELWPYLAVHHAFRQFAHTAALARPAVDTDRVSYLKCVRIVRHSIPSQLGETSAKLARFFTEARREARARLLPARRDRDCPRAIKKANRWPVLRTRARRGTVQPGRGAHNPTSKPKSTRRAGRPALKGTRTPPPP
ncbi:transposase [Streptomyces sp. Qhu_M48]|uniref:transposase n=1 Tax=Streptomyces sp. Qhu_M48 TaxID=3435889 RepID=UPI003F501C62